MNWIEWHKRRESNKFSFLFYSSSKRMVFLGSKVQYRYIHRHIHIHTHGIELNWKCVLFGRLAEHPLSLHRLILYENRNWKFNDDGCPFGQIQLTSDHNITASKPQTKTDGFKLNDKKKLIKKRMESQYSCVRACVRVPWPCMCVCVLARAFAHFDAK